MSELNIPEHWSELTFEEVFEMNPRNKIDDDNLDVSFVPMGAVDQERATIDLSENRKWGQVKKGYTHFKEGDIIFAKITPCMENKKSAICYSLTNGFGAGSTEFHVIRPPMGFVPKFPLYFLRSSFFLKDAAANMRGAAGQKRVATDWINKQLFPVPPCGEQERIVQKIESCFQKIDETEKALNEVEVLLTKYRESLLAKAFRGELIPQDSKDEPASTLLEKIRVERAVNSNGKKVQEFSPILDNEKPFDIPSNWVWGTSSEVCEYIIDCPHSTPDFTETGKMCLDTNSLKQGYIDYSKIRYVSLNTFNQRNSRLIPKKGDIVLSREGTIGNAVVLPDDEFCLGQRVMIFRTNEIIFPEYFQLSITSSDIANLYIKKKKGMGVAHINMSDLRSFAIPIPPKKEQFKIVNEIKFRLLKIQEIQDFVNTEKTLIEKLKESILQKAFEGHLVCKISSEGTGYELFAKILEAQKELAEEPEKKAPKKTVKKKAKK